MAEDILKEEDAQAEGTEQAEGGIREISFDIGANGVLVSAEKPQNTFEKEDPSVQAVLTPDDVFSDAALETNALSAMPLAISSRATYTRTTGTAGSHAHSTTAAGAVTVATMPPYIVLNVWKRIG